MSQGQMFPMNAEERITILRGNLAGDLEKRLAKRDAAAVALADAQEAEDGARGLLAVFDSMVAERAAQRGKSVMQTAADIVNSGALNTEDVTVTASITSAVDPDGIGVDPVVPPIVDPITGEVTSIPVDDWKCPTCRGDGRLPDKTGGGHHRCKDCNGTGHAEPSCDNCTSLSCNLKQRAGSSTMGCGGSSWMHGETMGKVVPPNVSVVVVLYPNSDEPVVTKIGEHTRYGELVADYFTSAGLTGKHDAKDWTVIAEDELTNEATAYGVRKLRDVISHDDYGKRLLIAAADQGSVTGTPAEKGAS